MTKNEIKCLDRMIRLYRRAAKGARPNDVPIIYASPVPHANPTLPIPVNLIYQHMGNALSDLKLRLKEQ